MCRSSPGRLWKLSLSSKMKLGCSRVQNSIGWFINIANGEYNKAIPRAHGEAAQEVRIAEGYAKKRINEAKGDAFAFNAVLTEYNKAPEVTRLRLYLETMAEILPPVRRKVILDENVKGVLPLINLGAEAETVKGIPR